VNAIVDRLKAALHAWADANESTVVIGDSAGEPELARLEHALAWRLPSDYRAFLAIADGLRIYDGTESAMIDLFPVARLPHPRDDDQRETLGEDGIDRAVPMHNLYVFLDKTTGETVKWMHFEAFRFPDFGAFLVAETDGLAV
jgi:cell wall assembly regulator SMI1